MNTNAASFARAILSLKLSTATLVGLSGYVSLFWTHSHPGVAASSAKASTTSATSFTHQRSQLLSELKTLPPRADSLASAAARSMLARKPREVTDPKPAALDERTYKKLARAHSYLGEKQYDKATDLLTSIIEGASKRPFVLAQSLQTLGHVHIMREDYKAALKAYQESVKVEALPKTAQLQALFTLAQLYAQQENFLQAAEQMRRFLAFSPKNTLNVQAWQFQAQVLAQLKLYRAASEASKEALRLSTSAKQNVLQLLSSVYVEAKAWPQATVALQALINAFPHEKSFWQQLAFLYLKVNQDKKAIAVFELAYQKGYLVHEREQLQLAQLYVQEGVPLRAAELTQKGLTAGIIEKTEKNLRFLADSLILAREQERALDILLQAADLSSHGQHDLTAGEIYVEQERWTEAAQAFKQAIKRGLSENKQRARASLSLGIAYTQLKKYEEASKALRRAVELAGAHAPLKKQAQQWLSYGDNRDHQAHDDQTKKAAPASQRIAHKQTTQDG